MRNIFHILCVGLLTACATFTTPNDIDTKNRISIYRLSCVFPYELKYGCDGKYISGIKHKLGSHHLKFAASADGTILFVENHYVEDILAAVVSGSTWGFVDPSTRRLNEGVRYIRNALEDSGVNITMIRDVRNALMVEAYILLSDGDMISALGLEPVFSQDLVKKAAEDVDQ